MADSEHGKEGKKPRIEILERKARVVAGGGPVEVRLDVGGGIGATWVFRLVRDGAVARLERGDTTSGGARTWTLDPAELPAGTELQVGVTLLAPAVEAPWQVGLSVRQGLHQRLDPAVLLAGSLGPGKATSRVLQVKLVPAGER